MPMATLVKTLWRRWTRVAHAVGTFQARVLLTVLYAVVLPPFALIARWGSDPLRLRPPDTPQWLPRPLKATGLEDGRRQFS
jgi:hypothetical protein